MSFHKFEFDCRSCGLPHVVSASFDVDTYRWESTCKKDYTIKHIEKLWTELESRFGHKPDTHHPKKTIRELICPACWDNGLVSATKSYYRQFLGGATRWSIWCHRCKRKAVLKNVTTTREREE